MHHLNYIRKYSTFLANTSSQYPKTKSELILIIDYCKIPLRLFAVSQNEVSDEEITMMSCCERTLNDDGICQERAFQGLTLEPEETTMTLDFLIDYLNENADRFEKITIIQDGKNKNRANFTFAAAAADRYSKKLALMFTTSQHSNSRADGLHHNVRNWLAEYIRWDLMKFESSLERIKCINFRDIFDKAVPLIRKKVQTSSTIKLTDIFFRHLKRRDFSSFSHAQFKYDICPSFISKNVHVRENFTHDTIYHGIFFNSFFFLPDKSIIISPIPFCDFEGLNKLNDENLKVCLKFDF